MLFKLFDRFLDDVSARLAKNIVENMAEAEENRVKRVGPVAIEAPQNVLTFRSAIKVQPRSPYACNAKLIA